MLKADELVSKTDWVGSIPTLCAITKEMKTYLYHNNILSIPASLLYEDWAVMSYSNYNIRCHRRQLIRSREGKGAGNEALLSFYHLPPELQELCIEKLGKPEEVTVINLLEPYIEFDKNASKYYADHRTPEGKSISPEKQRQRTLNCCILNAIQTIFKDNGVANKMFGKRKMKIWDNVSDAVNKLDTKKWDHSLPTAAKNLRLRYNDYLKNGYQTFIHKNEGNQNTTKIKGDVADFILAFYSLPIKLTIPMVLSKYNEVKEERNFPELTEAAIYKWLYEPEQERIWTLARHGKEAYNNKYQHKTSIDKSGWFPNIYWAIDGTKLDWIHFEGSKSNKMAASLRINVIFDVYSEKIIGWSFSESEDHTDHFKAMKMAAQHAGHRPYLFTYDKQSGHMSARMQELYSNVVAKDGGTHYSHRARSHSSPAEGLFKRLQQEVITKFWFSDGQSITVKRDDNKVNTDFILENQHHLKTKEDLFRAWETAVQKWNSAKHPHFNESRTAVYAHPMKQKEPLTLPEILSYMWVEESKPITYKNDGLTMKLKGETYQFEVYNQDRTIDTEFRRKNIGKKFIVRYDPDNMDVFVQLYEITPDKQKIFSANAEPKRKQVNIPILMDEADKKVWAIDYKIREEEFKRDLEAVEALRKRTGITPEKLIQEQDLDIKFKGSAPKKQAIAMDAESAILHRI